MLLLCGITATCIELGITRSKDIAMLEIKKHLTLWLIWPLGIVLMIIVSFVYLLLGKIKKAKEIRWGLSSMFKSMFTGSRY